MKNTSFRLIISLTLLFFTSTGFAENSKEFGDYVVHYNAFRSDSLLPEVAKSYNLTRRNNRIIVNITVLKKVMNTTGKPVSATVSGHASNLTGQLKSLDFREIKEDTARYYIAETKVSDGELLRFELKISPEGQDISTTLNFDKRFFIR